MARLPVFSPELQIAFSIRLAQIDALHLGRALANTIEDLELRKLDEELASLVPNDRLIHLAKFGLRGERIFPCPLVLTSGPRLLGYYRLLFGLSQKTFYGKEFSIFKAMEERGVMSAAAAARIKDLCASLCETAWLLVEGLPSISPAVIRDLQLLTLGTQLRGARLNEIGQAAVRLVFSLIREAIPDGSITGETSTAITLLNAAGRRVKIEFSSDPDISVTEVLSDSVRDIVAIEVKGGKDRSNIHNRLGEAEKSHQKAKHKGFREFWTIVNSPVDQKLARQESPTTDVLFDLTHIIDSTHEQHRRFVSELRSRLGI